MAITLPTDISGCKLWLSADRNVSITSGQVASIFDNSTQGSNGAATTRPTYATAPYKAMRFDASNAGTASTIRMNLSGGATLNKGGCTVAFICKVASACEGDPGVANQALISGSGDNFAVNVGSNFSTTIYNGSTTVRTQMRFPASISLVVVTTTASSATVYINGQSETIDASFTSTWVPTYVGNGDGSNSPFVGHIYEVMAYDTALTSTNVDDLLAYTQAKYGKEDEDTRIVCKGSSTTRGNASSGLCTNYVHLLEPSYPSATIFGFGIGGDDQDDIAGDAQLDVDAAFLPGIDNVCVLQTGSNDIYADGSTAAALIAKVKTYCLNRKAIGYKVVLQTVLPRGTAGSAANTVREAYNELLRAEEIGKFWDALADVAAIPELADGAQSSTTYYNSDTIHLNDAGHALITTVIKEAIDEALDTEDEPVDTYDLTTREHVLRQLGFTQPTGEVALGGINLDYIDDLIQEVSLSIARFCNRLDEDGNPCFLVDTRTEYYNGLYGPDVVLRASPIVEVDSVYTVESDGSETLVDDDEYRVDPSSGVLHLLGEDWAWDTGLVRAIGEGGPSYGFGPRRAFVAGFRNIKVTYEGGYTVVPPDLRRVATKMVVDEYLNRRTNRMMALDVAGSRSVSQRGVSDQLMLHAQELTPYVRPML